MYEAAQTLSIAHLVVSGVSATAGTIAVACVWTTILRGFGGRFTNVEAGSLFFTTQLGKYVPGSIWPAVAQMHFGRRWGVARQDMLAANILLIAFISASGVIVGGLLLPWSSPDGLAHYWWLLPCLGALLWIIHPKVLPWVLDLSATFLGREPASSRLTWSSVGRSFSWTCVTWVLLGTHVLTLVANYHPLDVALVAASIGGIALAWAAGLLFLPAPAGAGVREAVLVLTLLPFIEQGEALTVAISSRLLLVIADVMLALVAVVLRGGMRPHTFRPAGGRSVQDKEASESGRDESSPEDR